MRYVVIAFSVILTTGCASIVNETTQPIKVDTKSASGEVVNGAECKLTNDYGVFSVRSGETTMVHRSNKDLEIVCKQANNPDANARAVSRANAGLFGNIIVGGVIGAVVDHSRGTAYTYPKWVQLVFGKTLTFDRTSEKDGSPTPGDDGAAPTPAK